MPPCSTLNRQTEIRFGQNDGWVCKENSVMAGSSGRLHGADARLVIAHSQAVAAGITDLWNGLLSGKRRVLLYGSLVCGGRARARRANNFQQDGSAQWLSAELRRRAIVFANFHSQIGSHCFSTFSIQTRARTILQMADCSCRFSGAQVVFSSRATFLISLKSTQSLSPASGECLMFCPA